MGVLRQILGWLIRRLGLYLVLVLALAFATFAWPQLVRELSGTREAEERYLSVNLVSQTIAQERSEAEARLAASLQEMQQMGLGEIDRRLGLAMQERALLERQRTGRTMLLRVATDGEQAVLAHLRTELRFLLNEREIAGLSAARDLAEARKEMAGRDGQELRQVAVSLRQQCADAQGAVTAFRDRWQWQIERFWPGEEYRDLQATARDRCARSANADRILRGFELARQAEGRAQSAFASMQASLGADGDRIVADLAAERQAALTQWRGTWPERLRLWMEDWQITRLLWQAAVLLVAILMTPYLVRTLLYFLLAPVAQRRPAIRLSLPGGLVPSPVRASGPSAPSLTVQLVKGEEVLVRQGYLQSSAVESVKATRWLLSWSHPLSSLAAGLVFLTEVRGSGTSVTVSATRDPFAEVAEIELPDGASCVLLPRTLAAVRQREDSPLRITSHWRLWSLNAWLTLQWRFLVFHGPCSLVVHGGRGVRTEAAARGRIFGQSQLVGFSADIAYSVTRNETFWPYLFGREPLLRDKVEGGDGVLIIEEAPLSAGRDRSVDRGLEGAVDALLKAFGL